MNETVKIVNTDKVDLVIALRIAQNFMETYSDRVGVRNGVGYLRNGYKAYVYRLKSMVVVRGS